MQIRRVCRRFSHGECRRLCAAQSYREILKHYPDDGLAHCMLEEVAQQS